MPLWNYLPRGHAMWSCSFRNWMKEVLKLICSILIYSLRHPTQFTSSLTTLFILMSCQCDPINRSHSSVPSKTTNIAICMPGISSTVQKSNMRTTVKGKNISSVLSCKVRFAHFRYFPISFFKVPNFLKIMGDSIIGRILYSTYLELPLPATFAVTCFPDPATNIML